MQQKSKPILNGFQFDPWYIFRVVYDYKILMPVFSICFTKKQFVVAIFLFNVLLYYSTYTYIRRAAIFIDREISKAIFPHFLCIYVHIYTMNIKFTQQVNIQY